MRKFNLAMYWVCLAFVAFDLGYAVGSFIQGSVWIGLGFLAMAAGTAPLGYSYRKEWLRRERQEAR